MWNEGAIAHPVHLPSETHKPDKTENKTLKCSPLGPIVTWAAGECLVGALRDVACAPIFTAGARPALVPVLCGALHPSQASLVATLSHSHVPSGFYFLLLSSSPPSLSVRALPSPHLVSQVSSHWSPCLWYFLHRHPEFPSERTSGTASLATGQFNIY